jgi:hypothetical protein
MKSVPKKSDRRSHVPHYWLEAIRKPYEQAEIHRAEAVEDHRNNDEAPEAHRHHEEPITGLRRSRRSASSGWLAGRIRN